MTCYRKASLWLCLVLWLCVAICSGLMLERLPRRIPQVRPPDEGEREVEGNEDEEDSSVVEKKRLKQDNGQLSPLMMKPTWKALYPFGVSGRREERDVGRDEKKSHLQNHERDRREEGQDEEQEELANILKDEEDDKEKPEVTRPKAKRGTEDEDKKLKPARGPDFQEWLRQEYYRNMAKSFASMRRKRDGSSQWDEEPHAEAEAAPSTPLKRKRREQKSTEKKRQHTRPVSFEEVTDNLRALEDALFLDALGALSEESSAEEAKKARIEADLSSAYDLETMRGALFRLRETLGGGATASEGDEEVYLMPAKKSSDRCPPLNLLTSRCSGLVDLLPPELDSVKKMVFRACNWHEVCYTCGSAYGLNVDACDSGFVQQSRPICLEDSGAGVECENPASLLLVPLRQRRVFFKRSNPQLCRADPCIENYLMSGEEL